MTPEVLHALLVGQDVPELPLRPPWMEQGACRGPEPAGVTWFPKRGEVTAAGRAKAICGACPVQQDCREYALADDTLEGVWGGLSLLDRRAIRRGRQSVA